MRKLASTSLLAALIASVAVTANAEGIADRHSESVESVAIYSPYSGNHKVVRGQAKPINKVKVEVAANPYSGEHRVVRGQRIIEKQDS